MSDTSSQSLKQPVCLIVMDGWGISNPDSLKGDAVFHAETPSIKKLESEYPNMSIAAHGLSVGLPEGLMGNSEVGHLNIGAGRVVYQDIVRIQKCAQKESWMELKAFRDCIERCTKRSYNSDGSLKNAALSSGDTSAQGRLHLLTLVSDGGVHSHISHLESVLSTCKSLNVSKVFIHFFSDGRDTSPKSAKGYFERLQNKIDSLKVGKICTITGRYYAMDRDKRWDRIEIAYDAITQGIGEQSTDALETIQERYEKGETDEFLKPIILDKDGCVQDGDTLLFLNFRSDRMRQITQVFGKMDGVFPFDVKAERKNLYIATMTQYKADYPFPVLFPQQKMNNVLSEWLSKKGIKQMHVAETEKYAHVTFFFNGGTEKQYENEDREMIPSPKVATYDLQPEMSVIPVAESVARHVSSGKYPFVMCNFAPPDMVGHTGKYEPALKAIEASDKSIGIIYEACKKNGYVLFITADHGNAEKMLADDGITPHTAHTTARVPFIMTSKNHKFKDIKPQPNVEGERLAETGGALCDVAPSILEVMGLDKPDDMSGESLISVS